MRLSLYPSFQLVKEIRPCVRVFSVLILDGDAEIKVALLDLKGRLGDRLTVLDLGRACAASACGVEVDGVCLGAFDENSAVLVIKLVYNRSFPSTAARRSAPIQYFSTSSCAS